MHSANISRNSDREISQQSGMKNVAFINTSGPCIHSCCTATAPLRLDELCSLIPACFPMELDSEPEVPVSPVTASPIRFPKNSLLPKNQYLSSRLGTAVSASTHHGPKLLNQFECSPSLSPRLFRKTSGSRATLCLPSFACLSTFILTHTPCKCVLTL